ncbi:hypothetical protein AC230_10870 [Streptomyces caatingaensis]|uniref:Lipoprotein n=2 Tax=Streptomyces caatingaensis TaxID=1678637 RepID=A0A0K9XGA1_9ACTN|nr:hypothetical protein AC230_10870 [Streptomyces caatingaensis]
MVAASAALLTGATGAAGTAFADVAHHDHSTVSALHKATQKVTGDHDKKAGAHTKDTAGAVKGAAKNKGKHLGWEKGVDKKADHWDAQHKVWQRWDADSRGYAQWDEHAHCWKRLHNGHWQKWDTAHKAWK